MFCLFYMTRLRVFFSNNTPVHSLAWSWSSCLGGEFPPHPFPLVCLIVMQVSVNSTICSYNLVWQKHPLICQNLQPHVCLFYSGKSWSTRVYIFSVQDYKVKPVHKTNRYARLLSVYWTGNR
jgi:hypothetical protein